MLAMNNEKAKSALKEALWKILQFEVPHTEALHQNSLMQEQPHPEKTLAFIFIRNKHTPLNLWVQR